MREFGTKPGRFRLHFLLHPKCFEVICESALRSLHSSKEGSLVLEKKKTKRRRHNCGVEQKGEDIIVVWLQHRTGVGKKFCSAPNSQELLLCYITFLLKQSLWKIQENLTTVVRILCNSECKSNTWFYFAWFVGCLKDIKAMWSLEMRY